jgi:radical SAM PhpK family P-methyltransferase
VKCVEKLSLLFIPPTQGDRMEIAMVQEKDILLVGSIGRGYNDDNVIEETDITFNGAVAYLMTYLTRRGYVVDYVDCIEIEYEIIKEKINQNHYKLIGISTSLCNNMQSVIRLVKNIKALTDTKIVLGGIYIAKLLMLYKNEDELILQKILKRMNADYYINSYQGEYTLSQLIGAIKQNLFLDVVPNIYYMDNNLYKYTVTEIENNILEENVVDWNLIKQENKVGKILPVRTSQSCLFNCSFCTYKTFAGKYKSTTIEAIESELNSIAIDGNDNCLNFVDDTFNVPITRFKDILNMMIRNNYNFKWVSYLRCQFINDEVAELMKKSGCVQVFLGIESGSQVMLDLMNKQVKSSELKEGIKILKKHGIKTHGFFFIGFPGETSETVHETIRFIDDSCLDIYSITAWINDPMSPIFEKRKLLNIKGVGQNWSHNTMNSKEADEYVEEIVRATKVCGFRTHIQ